MPAAAPRPRTATPAHRDLRQPDRPHRRSRSGPVARRGRRAESQPRRSPAQAHPNGPDQRPAQRRREPGPSRLRRRRRPHGNQPARRSRQRDDQITATDRPLHAALRASASGVFPTEAGVGLLIGHGTWLHRDDFAGAFVHTGVSITDGITKMAQIDWPAAIAALDAGSLPCSALLTELTPGS